MSNDLAKERLRIFIERIERLEEEKAALVADIKEVYREASGNGYDARTMREIVKLRRLDRSERQEREALLDIYKAAMGMLDGTPLGEAAVRRLSGKKPPAVGDEAQPDIEDAADAAPPVDATAATPPATIDQARQMGQIAGQTGKPVTTNPFIAGDPRRAAWDEAWCQATGSDGMEVPAAWRRSKKDPKRRPGSGAEGSGGDDAGTGAPPP